MIAKTETEAKWSVSKAAHGLLLSVCEIVQVTDQLNVYFDDGWALARAGATCRVRIAASDAALFTLKIPKGLSSDGARTSTELEMPALAVFGEHYSIHLRHFEGRTLAAPLGEALSALNVSRLARVGRMRNRRHLLRLPSGGWFELDQYSMPGGEVGYEVEVETEDVQERVSVVSSIRRLVPDAVPSTKSKFQRFRDATVRVYESRSRQSESSRQAVGVTATR